MTDETPRALLIPPPRHLTVDILVDEKPRSVPLGRVYEIKELPGDSGGENYAVALAKDGAYFRCTGVGNMIVHAVVMTSYLWAQEVQIALQDNDADAKKG